MKQITKFLTRIAIVSAMFLCNSHLMAQGMIVIPDGYSIIYNMTGSHSDNFSSTTANNSATAIIQIGDASPDNITLTGDFSAYYGNFTFTDGSSLYFAPSNSNMPAKMVIGGTGFTAATTFVKQTGALSITGYDASNNTIELKPYGVLDLTNAANSGDFTLSNNLYISSYNNTNAGLIKFKPGATTYKLICNDGTIKTDDPTNGQIDVSKHFQFDMSAATGTPGDYSDFIVATTSEQPFITNASSPIIINQGLWQNISVQVTGSGTYNIILHARYGPCIVTIPDANFKAALLANVSINTNSDGEIQCSEATAFTGTIDVSNKSISNLTGIEAFTHITLLECYNNLLTNMDISSNTALLQVNCEHNQLKSLDVSAAHTTLTSLLCGGNQIANLDLSTNTALTQLWCSANLLTSLDVSHNINLDRFLCSNNSLTGLDVSANTALQELGCDGNSLTNLDVKNGNNFNFTYFSATNNPGLTCIQVDNAAWSTTNWTNKDAGASYSTDCNLCIVTIPDDNFRNYLLNNPSINTINDGVIDCSEAATYAGHIDVSGLGITNLTGIEAFKNIYELDCYNNSLTSLDVSHNTALNYLYCNDDHLSSLNVSGLTSLIIMDCYNNSLTTLDISTNTALYSLNCNDNLLTSLNISGLTSISFLQCYNNQLTSLDVHLNTALIDLKCYNNHLTSLNVSGITSLNSIDCSYNSLTSLDVHLNAAFTNLDCNHNSLTSLNLNTALTYLNCNNNSLTSLDVHLNTALTTLYCSDNSLTSLDLNTALTDLRCYGNHLSSLDVSTNTALRYLYCANNLLTSLNVKNGNNNSFSGFDATNNPSLICIQVDDAVWSTANWTNKDAGASYSTDCNSCTVNIPNANFKAALLAIAGLDANHDNEIQCSEATDYTGAIDVSGLSISNLTGIEAFTNITYLDCSNNSLTSLDVHLNTALNALYCNNNLLASLNVSGLISLYEIDCYNNSLTSLNVSSNTALHNLFCYNNSLTSLDVHLNTALNYLHCYNNSLTSLDVSFNIALIWLECNNNQLSSLNVKNGNNTSITDFDATNNAGLSCIQVDDAGYCNSHTPWTSGINGSESFNTVCTCIVYIPNANFKAALLAISGLDANTDGEIQCTEALTLTGTLDVSNKSISNLTGIEAFTNITGLLCNSNSLTSLDVSSNTALTDLRCNNNSLTSLAVSANTALQYLICNNNSLTSLAVSANTALQYLFCNNNPLTSLDVSANTALIYLFCNDNSLTSLNVLSNTALNNLTCSNNSLTSLDVSANTALIQVDCENNQLTALHVSANTALTSLLCDGNQITNLDLSANTALIQLWCYNNLLTSLDVSANHALTQLLCYNNSLTSLNVKNGNNTNISGGGFNAISNDGLACIQVDNAIWSTTHWTNKDAGASYSTDCSFTSAAIDYFRSVASGNWSIPSKWESSHDNAAWATATLTPTSAATLITIKSPNNVTININNQTASAIVIESGATLTNSGANTLNVSGNWTNNGGTFTPAMGMVNFNGSSQAINGSSGTTFNNLTLSGSGVKTLTISPTVNGILSMEGTAIASAAPTYGASATLQYKGSATQTTGNEFPSTFSGTGGVKIDNSNGVTLGSSKTISNGLNIATGALTVNPTIALTVGGTTTLGSAECLIIKSEGSFIDNGITINGAGSVKVEKSLAAGRWWYIGSPISTATAGDAFGITATPTTGVGTRLYYWEEQPANNWIPVLSTSYPTEVLKGYSFKSYTVDPYPVVFIGSLNTGTIGTSSLTYTSGSFKGFNLVCNPYPSAINWGKAGSPNATLVAKTNLAPSLWVKREFDFATYNYTSGTGQNQGDSIVPAMQAIWVRVASAGTGGVQFTNAARLHSSHAFYKTTSETNIFRMTVSDGTTNDEAVIGFYQDAQDVFENFDSEKMMADEDIPQLYSLTSDNTEVAINGQPELAAGEERIVPLGFSTNVAGTFTLNATNLNDFDPSVSIYLEDVQQNVLQDLNQNASYTFTSGVVNTASRFKLHFGNILTSVSTFETPATLVYADNNKIYVNTPSTGIVEIYNILGEKIATVQAEKGLNKFQLNTAAGIYVVKVQSGSDIMTKKIFIGN